MAGGWTCTEKQLALQNALLNKSRVLNPECPEHVSWEGVYIGEYYSFQINLFFLPLVVNFPPCVGISPLVFSLHQM
jgi:hypothetical protein